MERILIGILLIVVGINVYNGYTNAKQVGCILDIITDQQANIFEMQDRITVLERGLWKVMKTSAYINGCSNI